MVSSLGWGAAPFGNLKEKIFLEGIKPVLSDSEFSEVLSKL